MHGMISLSLSSAFSEMIRDTFTARVCFFFFFFARVCVGLCAVREFGVVAGRESNDFFFVVKRGVYYFSPPGESHADTRHRDTATTQPRNGDVAK